MFKETAGYPRWSSRFPARNGSSLARRIGVCVTSQFSSAEWPAPFLTSLWESRYEWRGWIELANHGNCFQDQFNAFQSTWRATFQALYSILVKGRPFSTGFEVFSSSHYLGQVFSIGLPVIILYREQLLLLIHHFHEIWMPTPNDKDPTKWSPFPSWYNCQ
jgi:hypothetical protein